MDGYPCSPSDSQDSSPTPQFKSINYSVLNFLYSPTLTSIHDYWKNHSFDYFAFVGKVMSLLSNILSRFVIVSLPRSKCLLISRLQSPSAVILEPKKIKLVTFSIVSPSICYEVLGLDAMIFVFWKLSFKPAFSSVWNESNCVVVWKFFGIAFLWDWNGNWPLLVLWLLLSFPNVLAYWLQHFQSIIF